MCMFFLGLVIGSLLCLFLVWWGQAFHDVKVINKAVKEQWEFDTRWAAMTHGLPPPPPNIHVAK